MNHFICRLFSVFLLLSVYLSALAQKEFYNGYIIKESGDTVRGKISFRETDYNPKKILFRSLTDTAVYTTNHLKEFMVIQPGSDTVIFRKAVVTYGASRVRLIELTGSDSAILVRDTVFLELVMDGPLKLYTLKTYSFRTNYYMQQSADSAAEELVFRKYTAEHEDFSTATVSKYKFQLLRAMGSCAKAKKTIVEMRFKEKELIKLFEEYNTCFGENKIPYLRKRERTQMFFSAFGGFNSAWVLFPSGDKRVKSKLIRGNGYTVGLAFNVGLSRSVPKFWITNEIAITGFKVKGTTPRYYSNFTFQTRDIVFHLLYLKLRVLPAYYFGRSYSKVVPYINAGPSFGYLLKAIENRTYYANQPDRKDPALVNLKTYDLGFAFSFGLRFITHASVEAKYEFGDGFAYRNNPGAKTHSLMVTGRINIGQKPGNKPL